MISENESLSCWATASRELKCLSTSQHQQEAATTNAPVASLVFTLPHLRRAILVHFWALFTIPQQHNKHKHAPGSSGAAHAASSHTSGTRSRGRVCLVGRWHLGPDCVVCLVETIRVRNRDGVRALITGQHSTHHKTTLTAAANEYSCSAMYLSPLGTM